MRFRSEMSYIIHTSDPSSRRPFSNVEVQYLSIAILHHPIAPVKDAAPIDGLQISNPLEPQLGNRVSNDLLRMIHSNHRQKTGVHIEDHIILDLDDGFLGDVIQPAVVGLSVTSLLPGNAVR